MLVGLNAKSLRERVPQRLGAVIRADDSDLAAERLRQALAAEGCRKAKPKFVDSCEATERQTVTFAAPPSLTAIRGPLNAAKRARSLSPLTLIDAESVPAGSAQHLSFPTQASEYPLPVLRELAA